MAWNTPARGQSDAPFPASIRAAALAAAERPVSDPWQPFRTTGQDGRVLVALDAGEMEALREYWDRRERLRQMLGRGHG